MKREERRVTAHDGLAAEPVEQVRAPLAEVDDPRRHALGVEAEAQDVDGRLEEVVRRAADEQRDGAVGGDEPPVAVDDHGRTRLVTAQDPVDRLADRPHLRLVEVALRVGGREAGGEEERVAVAKRHVEVLGELDDHVGAGLRAAGLDEADVAGRHARLEREVLLAHAAPEAPVAQERSDAGAVGDPGGHGRHASGGGWAWR